RSGGIGGQHAADGTLSTAGRVWREAAPAAGKLRVQLMVNDAGLQSDGIRADVQDGAEVPAEIDNEAVAQRLTREAGPGPARHQRKAVLRGIADQGLNILFVSWHSHSQRLNLKNAGVGAVQGARQLVEEKLSLENALEVVADVFALLFVHGHLSIACVSR